MKQKQNITDNKIKNEKLRIALEKIIDLCDNTKQHLSSEIWAQRIGYAKQMLKETE